MTSNKHLWLITFQIYFPLIGQVLPTLRDASAAGARRQAACRLLRARVVRLSSNAHKTGILVGTVARRLRRHVALGGGRDWRQDGRREAPELLGRSHSSLRGHVPPHSGYSGSCSFDVCLRIIGDRSQRVFLQ